METLLTNRISKDDQYQLQLVEDKILFSGIKELFSGAEDLSDVMGVSLQTIVENFTKDLFVFSDDIPWCKSNLNIHDAVFVDWNTGEDSYIDMYLMKHTKANIIANSTFSYWGAYFNANHPLVIYPKKWKYSESEEALDIFPDNWIGMESE